LDYGNFNQPNNGSENGDGSGNGYNGENGYNGGNGFNGGSDFGSGSPNGQEMPPVRPPYARNAMAIASFSCGVAGMFVICFGGSPILGALGIIFALLSRTDRLSPPAKIGLGLSIAGLILCTVSIVLSLFVLSSTGTLDKIVKEAESIDWSDQYAVQDFSYDIQDDIIQMLQDKMNQLPGYGSFGSSGSNAAGGTAADSGITASVNQDSEFLQKYISYKPVDQDNGDGGVKPDGAVAHADGQTSAGKVFCRMAQHVPSCDDCEIQNGRMI